MAHRWLVAESLNFVELVPDLQARPRDDETLAGRRERRLPSWLVRAAALSARTPVRAVTAGVLVLGVVLAGDGPARSPGAAPPASVLGASPYFYDDGSECPVAVLCAVENRVRQDFWSSFNVAFVGAEATSGGHVWYSSGTGRVYVQALRAKQGEVTILLSQTRISRGSMPRSGPSVSEFDVPLQWGHAITPRTVMVTAERGPWEVTVTLRGQWDGRMPIAEARQWVTTAPTPD